MNPALNFQMRIYLRIPEPWLVYILETSWENFQELSGQYENSSMSMDSISKIDFTEQL